MGVPASIRVEVNIKDFKRRARFHYMLVLRSKVLCVLGGLARHIEVRQARYNSRPASNRQLVVSEVCVCENSFGKYLYSPSSLEVVQIKNDVWGLVVLAGFLSCVVAMLQ
ncbi:hypothetical protein OK016_27710 [Vibrio chagasii]|nr:hypothetical protein [Vibrio chagasii]